MRADTRQIELLPPGRPTTRHPRQLPTRPGRSGLSSVDGEPRKAVGRWDYQLVQMKMLSSAICLELEGSCKAPRLFRESRTRNTPFHRDRSENHAVTRAARRSGLNPETRKSRRAIIHRAIRVPGTRKVFHFELCGSRTRLCCFPLPPLIAFPVRPVSGLGVSVQSMPEPIGSAGVASEWASRKLARAVVNSDAGSVGCGLVFAIASSLRPASAER